jgi:uncharacterized protein YcbK (DUF882 family)
MTPKQWKQIKYFSPQENFGDPSKMDFRLIWLLDRLREAIDEPIIIHCGYETSGHSENSYHYKGRAVDFHFKKSEWLNFKDLTKLVRNHWYWVGGIGVYPHWRQKGFHVDTGRPRVWEKDLNGNYIHG